MMTVLIWFSVIVLWIIAAAFAVSDILFILAVIYHFRKDRELTAIYAVVIPIFGIFSAGSAYAALAVWRCL